MKTYKIAVLVLLTFLSTFSFAQSKIGHINTNELLKQMPEVVEAQKKVDEINKLYQERIDAMVAEYTQLYKSIQELPENTTQAIFEDEQKKLIQMEERIQSFREKAEEESMAKQKELLEPILEKVQKAIDEVAEEEGFDYVLDTSAGIVLFANDSDDITPLVKAKLGLVE